MGSVKNRADPMRCENMFTTARLLEGFYSKFGRRWGLTCLVVYA